MTESSYCCIQLAPSREDGTALLHFVPPAVFELYVSVDNLLALSLTTSHACLCNLAVAARTMFLTVFVCTWMPKIYGYVTNRHALFDYEQCGAHM